MGTYPQGDSSAPKDAAGQQGGRERATDDDRDRRADERDAEERERGADARDSAAEERERSADARENTADVRERIADAREQAANARESAADERQERLASWEKQADERLRAMGQSAPSLRQRSYEQISRVKDLLAASKARLDRSQAALRRADAADSREQGCIDRQMVSSTARQAHEAPPSHEVLEVRAQQLGRQAATAAAALAETLEALAREGEGRRSPQESAEHRRRAEVARDAAAALRATAEEPGDGGGAS